jgi:hypothetical protein
VSGATLSSGPISHLGRYLIFILCAWQLRW